MKAFDVLRPNDLFQAFNCLEKDPEGTAIKSGGTDLLIWIKKGLISPRTVIDLTSIESLYSIEEEPKGLLVGTNVPLNRVISCESVKRYFPALKDACQAHSDATIRNKATLVGNVCSAVPSGDTLPPLLCYNAEVIIQSSCSKRALPLSQFLLGPRRKNCLKTELVTHVRIPFPPKGHNKGIYRRATRRNALDLAQASVACVRFSPNTGTEYRIAFGALSPVPVRVSEAEKLLNVKHDIDRRIIESVIQYCLERLNPISDVRGSKAYRLSITSELIREVLLYCTGIETEEAGDLDGKA
jgi:carbon-monoxide dehydrogenase medium subunit